MSANDVQWGYIKKTKDKSTIKCSHGDKKCIRVPFWYVGYFLLSATEISSKPISYSEFTIL